MFFSIALESPSLSFSLSGSISVKRAESSEIAPDRPRLSTLAAADAGNGPFRALRHYTERFAHASQLSNSDALPLSASHENQSRSFERVCTRPLINNL